MLLLLSDYVNGGRAEIFQICDCALMSQAYSYRATQRKGFMISNGEIFCGGATSIRRILCNLVGCFLFGFISIQACGQISFNFLSPASGVVVQTNVIVNVQIFSTYELATVQATLGGNSVALTNPISVQWQNSISTSGIGFGTNLITVIATDVLGNSNQTQRLVVRDLPPIMTVSNPPNYSVVRTGSVLLSASTTDDSPTVPALVVMQSVDYTGGTILASITNSNPSTNVLLADSQPVSLFFRSKDSANQVRGAFRVVYTLSSTNLVEVARVSTGEIKDVQSDRILFTSIDNQTLPPESYDTATRWQLKSLSRATGTETLLYEGIGTNIGAAALAPQGALIVLNKANESKLYHISNSNLIKIGEAGLDVFFGPGTLDVAVKGKYALWGWPASGNDTPKVFLTDLDSHNSPIIPNAGGRPYRDFEFAANGDVVFIPQNVSPGHAVARYRNDTVTQLASDSINTNSYPKTDGNVVCYLKSTSTNQVLMMITNGGEIQIAEGSAIGSDFQINNGWVAYARNGGSGTMQIWRRSPAGTSAQLTFWGTSSSIAALAPNGEVALFNGASSLFPRHLYISQGTWPPVNIAETPARLYYAGSALKPFWQDGRWCATLGGSLFQIHLGVPQVTGQSFSNGQFRLDVMAAAGQQIVTQCSSNGATWIDIATNNVGDNANLSVFDNEVTSNPMKLYRLKLR